MNILIAIDSFKGSMSSLEAGTAAAEGIRSVCPEAQTRVFPIADGGEGTVDALVAGLGGSYCEATVSDPLGRPVCARYGIVGQTAVLEMAQAAGLALLKPEERDPKKTTTFGVGELIRDAIGRGARDFLIGIGGSATNDGGVGMLQALGFSFRDACGNELQGGASALGQLASIHTESALPELQDCRFCIACDVTNPLCGDTGCSAVFSPQKGATPEEIPVMDAALANYARLTCGIFPFADPDSPGAGAAGGLGFAFASYLHAEKQPGIRLVLSRIGLERQLPDADLVITGEGRMDAQTVMGKAPVGVAQLAKKYGKPVVALAGCLSEDAPVCNRHGIDALFPILQAPCTVAEAMQPAQAKRNMSATAAQIFRLWLAGTGKQLQLC